MSTISVVHNAGSSHIERFFKAFQTFKERSFSIWFKSDRAAIKLLQTASYLADPMCKSHESFRRIHTVESLYPNACILSNQVRKLALGIMGIGYAVLGFATTLPSIVLRVVGHQMQEKEGFIQVRNAALRALPNPADLSNLKFLFFNICGIAGGYCITDGGVTPISCRIEKIAKEILSKGADVVCLCEVFDFQSAFYLQQKFMDCGYSDCYLSIGGKSIWLHSGIFVASRFPTLNARFVPFFSESMSGRSRFMSRGLFLFDLPNSEKQTTVTVCVTHLQHSEIPAYPTKGEKESRKLQMEQIVKASHSINHPMIVLGDMNMHRQEYSERKLGEQFVDVMDEKCGSSVTWGGDDLCSQWVDRIRSEPLKLDYILLKKESNLFCVEAKTNLMGFMPNQYLPEALSDHSILEAEFSFKTTCEELIFEEKSNQVSPQKKSSSKKKKLRVSFSDEVLCKNLIEA